MSKSVIIPQEIIDNVITAVGDDTKSLKKCALVSSSFLRPSRKQLFSKISIERYQTSQGIHQLLTKNPVIQSFVRTISIKHMSGPKSANKHMNSTSLLAILRLPFCHLECFSITVNRDSNLTWNSFKDEMKDALSNIILSSTIKTLCIDGVPKLPITFFHRIVHLTTLEVHSLTPIDFPGEKPSSLTQATSTGVATMASESPTVIDKCVWRFTAGDIEGSITNSTAPKFLPFMRGLRFLEIYIKVNHATPYEYDIYSLVMRSLCTSLTSPATLEYLKFDIRMSGIYNYFGHALYDRLREADVWRHLDSISTHPAGSRLQRIDICYNYAFREKCDKDEVLKAIFDGLPSLRMKGILFVEANKVVSDVAPLDS